jgi:hypothetical protein
MPALALKGSPTSNSTSLTSRYIGQIRRAPHRCIDVIRNGVHMNTVANENTLLGHIDCYGGLCIAEVLSYTDRRLARWDTYLSDGGGRGDIMQIDRLDSNRGANSDIRDALSILRLGQSMYRPWDINIRIVNAQHLASVRDNCREELSVP